MTKEQLASEKTVLQKNLLYYEGLHGRPVGDTHTYICTLNVSHACSALTEVCLQVTREERLIVKPLYDRYRLVKQMLTRVSITPIIVSLLGLCCYK